MILFDCLRPRKNIRSIVFSFDVVGLFISHSVPSIIMSGVLALGVLLGGISSILWPFLRKKSTVRFSCGSRRTPFCFNLPIFFGFLPTLATLPLFIVARNNASSSIILTAPTLLKGISSLVHHITSPTPGTTITKAESAIRTRVGTGGLEVALLRPAKPTSSACIPMATCARRSAMTLGTGSRSAA